MNSEKPRCKSIGAFLFVGQGSPNGFRLIRLYRLCINLKIHIAKQIYEYKFDICAGEHCLNVDLSFIEHFTVLLCS